MKDTWGSAILLFKYTMQTFKRHSQAVILLLHIYKSGNRSTVKQMKTQDK